MANARSSPRPPRRKVWEWDFGSTVQPAINLAETGGLVWSATFDQSGEQILSIGGNDAQLWQRGASEPLMRFSPHGVVAGVDISPDGKLVATGSWDHSAKLWDAATGQPVRSLEGAHTGYVNTVEFPPNDNGHLLTASDDRTARVWDLATGKPTDVILTGHTGRVLQSRYSPDGQRILTVSGDKTARLWDATTGAELKEFRGHQWAVLSGAFSPDGKQIVTGSEDHTAKVWDVATGLRACHAPRPHREHRLGGVQRRWPPHPHRQPRQQREVVGRRHRQRVAHARRPQPRSDQRHFQPQRPRRLNRRPRRRGD